MGAVEVLIIAPDENWNGGDETVASKQQETPVNGKNESSGRSVQSLLAKSQELRFSAKAASITNDHWSDCALSGCNTCKVIKMFIYFRQLRVIGTQ